MRDGERRAAEGDERGSRGTAISVARRDRSRDDVQIILFSRPPVEKFAATERAVPEAN